MPFATCPAVRVSYIQVRIGLMSWADGQSAKYNVDEDRANAAPKKAPATTPPLLIRLLCCGSTSFHWWLDTFAGLLLTAGFSIACAIILSPGGTPQPKVNSFDEKLPNLTRSNATV